MKPFYWALLAALTWGCVPIFEKLGLAKVSALPGLFYRSMGVLLGAVILLVVQFQQIKEAAGNGSWSNLWYLMIGGFLASVIGQIFFYNALKYGEASQVVPLAGVYPLISFILGLIFLGEHFTMAKVVGLAFVMIGVILLK